MAHGAPSPGKKVIGPGAGMQQPQKKVVALVQTITHHDFMFMVSGLPEGGRSLMFFSPNGDAHEYPLDQDASKKMVEKLISPEIDVPDMGVEGPTTEEQIRAQG